MQLARFFGSFAACREVGCFTGAEDPYATEDTFVEIVCRPAVRPIAEDGTPLPAMTMLDHMRSLVRTGCFSGDPPSEADVSISNEPQLVQEVMMSFIRTLLRGICVEVLLDDGTVLLPEASLNYELTQLILDVSDDQAQQRTTDGAMIQGRRNILLKDIETVATPSELARMNIMTSTQPHLDDRCCTLIIRDFEFVTFRFDTERLCEYFASCLKILITAPANMDCASAAFSEDPFQDSSTLVFDSRKGVL
jgi:hypothetical protein